MNVENQMQVHRVAVTGPPGRPEAPAESGQVGALALLHRHLRGRYAMAIALGLVLAVIGGVSGFMLAGPQYTSEALLQVRPTIPRTLYQTDENQIPPMFENFVATQAALIEAPRVFEVAVEDAELVAAGWEPRPRGISRLKQAISVKYRRGSQVISIEATCDDPTQAQKAVNAVLRAYHTLYGEQGIARYNERISELQTRRATLENEAAAKRSSILNLSARFVTDELDPLLEARLSEMFDLERQIREVSYTIASIEPPPVDEQGGASEASPPDLTVEYLATLDAELKDLLAERQALDAEIETARRFGPRHVQTRRLEEDRRILETRITSRAAQIREWIESRGTTGDPALPPDTTLPQAKALLTRLTADLEAKRQEVAEIRATRRTIDELRVEEERTRASLAETVLALEQQNVERQNIQQGRVDPIYGDLPSGPSRDRRFQLAVLGGLAGAGLGVGLVLLVGLLKPSYRYLDEIEEAETIVPVLGTLPDLTSRAEDLDSLASLSVHHLRNMLSMQARPRRDAGTAFVITSARPGDGKTSLTVALGMSFAAQGARTLVIDADLVGHGLSSSMGFQERDGLRQVARGAALEGAVCESRFSGFWVLPAGTSTRHGASRNGSYEAEHLSADTMLKMMEEARRRFDIILIDTGPLMGSLEANVVATVADRIVLTVPRGQDPRLVRAALGRLHSIGAVCAGLVFNRATAGDLRSSMSTVSFHSQSMRTAGTKETESAVESRHALVRAILMSGKSGGGDSTPTESDT